MLISYLLIAIAIYCVYVNFNKQLTIKQTILEAYYQLIIYKCSLPSYSLS